MMTFKMLKDTMIIKNYSKFFLFLNFVGLSLYIRFFLLFQISFFKIKTNIQLYQTNSKTSIIYNSQTSSIVID